MSKDSEQSRRVQIFVDAKRAKWWLAALLAAVVAAGALGSPHGVERIVGYGSAAATLFAAAFAILIYSWTARNSAALERLFKDRLDELSGRLDEEFESRAGSASAGELEGPAGEDAAEETLPSDVPDGELGSDLIGSIDIVINGVLLRQVPLPSVPIKVLGDLYSHWKSHNYSGRWSLGRIVEVRRKPGRGNNPYLLLFRAGEGEAHDDYELWRVAYGGQGKSEATVRKF